MIFDLLEMLNERPYTKVSLRERREKLCDYISPGRLATSLICDNRQEVDDCFRRAVSHGYEGIVVKNLNETLEGQTWVKMKFEDEIELKISKVEDSRLETLHGNVVVGLGLNVVDVWQVGDIALVRHNGITNGGSLRNPRIVRKL
jgi:ATP-dependent DNA ligase